MMSNLRPKLRLLCAAAVLAILLLLGWECIDIYLAGVNPANLDENGVLLSPIYTMADVGARLQSLAIPFFLCALVIVVSLFIHAGKDADAGSTRMQPDNKLRLLKKRIAHLPEAASREEKQRRILYAVCGMVVLVCCAFCAVYLADASHFTSWDLETVMGDMLLHITPWSILALAAVYAASVLRDRSILRECKALKGASTDAQPVEASETPQPVRAVRMILLCMAILFIILGVMNGGLYDVLVKAINICTECIGLG